MRSLEFEPALTSLANPRVKGWAKLSERKHREKEGRFKLEGVHLVKEALLAGWPLECVVFDEGLGLSAELEAAALAALERAEAKGGNGAARASGGEAGAAVRAGGGGGAAGDVSESDGARGAVRARGESGAAGGTRTGGSGSDGATRTQWIPVSPDIIAKCSETETPQPVFAVAWRRKLAPEALFAPPVGRPPGAAGPVAVLDGVQDPGNVGTIIRCAAASGASAVVLGRGTADLYNAKTLRATMGALFHVPVLEADLAELLPQARERGKRLYGTSLQATKSCYACDLSGGDAWLLFGNEGSGLSPVAEGLVDEPIIIPMTGQAESLNVAMAATVLLFEAQRQRLMSYKAL